MSNGILLKVELQGMSTSKRLLACLMDPRHCLRNVRLVLLCYDRLRWRWTARHAGDGVEQSKVVEVMQDRNGSVEEELLMDLGEYCRVDIHVHGVRRNSRTGGHKGHPIHTVEKRIVRDIADGSLCTVSAHRKPVHWHKAACWLPAVAA